MIFAELEYSAEYEDFHAELKRYLAQHFKHVESGLQGDSWFWIFEGPDKVAIDTFSSMKHQVKATSPGPLVRRVIAVLRLAYGVREYSCPELEPHESDAP